MLPAHRQHSSGIDRFSFKSFNGFLFICTNMQINQTCPISFRDLPLTQSQEFRTISSRYIRKCLSLSHCRSHDFWLDYLQINLTNLFRCSSISKTHIEDQVIAVFEIAPHGFRLLQCLNRRFRHILTDPDIVNTTLPTLLKSNIAFYV